MDEAIERVVVVHRLREVMALVGFTRFEPLAPDIEGELEMGVRRAALAREITWLPAVENRGEGHLPPVQARPTIEAWLQRPEVLQRALALKAGFECWQDEHQGSKREVPWPALHHAALVLAPADHGGRPGVRLPGQFDPRADLRLAGLPATASCSTRLRPTPKGRWAGWSRSAGGFTSTSARRWKWASCAPTTRCVPSTSRQNPHERRFLHGAACHGCLLIAETSCEQHNDFLDRALVVPTVDNLGVEFFKTVTDMNDDLLQLADSDLRELAAALRARRLAAPFTAMSVQRLIAGPWRREPWLASCSDWPTRGSRRSSWRSCSTARCRPRPPAQAGGRCWTW